MKRLINCDRFSLFERLQDLLQLLPLAGDRSGAAALQFGHFFKLLFVQSVGVLEENTDMMLFHKASTLYNGTMSTDWSFNEER